MILIGAGLLFGIWWYQEKLKKQALGKTKNSDNSENSEFSENSEGSEHSEAPQKEEITDDYEIIE